MPLVSQIPRSQGLKAQNKITWGKASPAPPQEPTPKNIRQALKVRSNPPTRQTPAVRQYPLPLNPLLKRASRLPNSPSDGLKAQHKIAWGKASPAPPQEPTPKNIRQALKVRNKALNRQTPTVAQGLEFRLPWPPTCRPKQSPRRVELPSEGHRAGEVSFERGGSLFTLFPPVQYYPPAPNLPGLLRGLRASA